jgi:hypothetical protein
MILSWAIIILLAAVPIIIAYFNRKENIPKKGAWIFALTLLSGLGTVGDKIITSSDGSAKDKHIDSLAQTNIILADSNKSISSQNAALLDLNIKKSDSIRRLSDTIQMVGTATLNISKNINRISTATNTMSKNIDSLSKANILIANSNANLTAENIKLTRTVNSYISGGDSSYLTLGPFRINEYSFNSEYSSILFPLINRGEFPLDNVRINVYLQDYYWGQTPYYLGWEISNTTKIFSFVGNNSPGDQIRTYSNSTGIRKPLIDTTFETFKSGQSYPLKIWNNWVIDTLFGFDIVVTSKKQDWVILVRAHTAYSQNGYGTVVLAVRVFKITGKGLVEIEDRIDSKFPLKPAGKMNWYREPIPDYYFPDYDWEKQMRIRKGT